MFYSLLTSLFLTLHLLFILWVVFGAFLTRHKPLLRWLHLVSLVWGIVMELLPWPCPLTLAEEWFRSRAGLAGYQGGFLLHYLDTLVYPDVPPTFLTVVGVAVCVLNLGIYVVRFQHRNAVDT